jgi:hypothetical protein
MAILHWKQGLVSDKNWYNYTVTQIYSKQSFRRMQRKFSHIFLTLYHTIQNFNNPNKKDFNPFPHNDTILRPWETSLLKTPWEKEKLLVTSNFSFTHRVFYLFK